MKAALLYYMKTLANHLAEKGIRANVVSPGTTYFKGGFWHKVEVDEPDVFAETMKSNPIGPHGHGRRHRQRRRLRRQPGGGVHRRREHRGGWRVHAPHSELAQPAPGAQFAHTSRAKC